MENYNSVFIATSLDRYIADRNGEIGWLDSIEFPENEDHGYYAFMNRIDALVMGRHTFETVLGFDIEWPYEKPVFVYSSSLKSIPDKLRGRAFLVNGAVTEILDHIHKQGHHRLYIDGGKTIQSFLKEDLIDEMIITTFPILLGGGASLFSETPKELSFELVESKVFFGQLVQSHYRRKLS